MPKTSIRCSGVPEHYNYPWIKSAQNKKMEAHDAEILWTDDPSGTGSLCKRLAKDEIDVAILLLDGAIKNCDTSEFKILNFYVDTPIIWGVYADIRSTLNKGHLGNPSFAISRYTSGSHHMAYLYAKQKGLSLKDSSFEVVHNIDGAIRSMSKNHNQLFLWETFITKPLVDNGTFKLIETCPTPWPAFVVAVSNSFFIQYEELAFNLVRRIQKSAQEIKSNPKSVTDIARYYNLQEQDVSDWIKTVEWTNGHKINTSAIAHACTILQRLGIIEKPLNLSETLARPTNIDVIQSN